MTVISICTVTYQDTPEALHRAASTAAESVLHAGHEPEIVIVGTGNPATNETAVEPIRQWCNRRQITFKYMHAETNTGFGAGTNLAVTHSNGQHILVLNPDTETPAGTVRHLHDHLHNRRRHHHDLIVGGWLVHNDQTPQIDATLLFLSSVSRKIRYRTWTRKVIEHHQNGRTMPVKKICGGAMYLHRDTYVNLRGYDPSWWLYHEDTDLSLRAAKAGITLEAVPAAVIIHHREPGGGSQQIEAARVDGTLRAAQTHHGTFTRWVLWAEQAVIATVGLVKRSTTSGTVNARLGRYQTLRHWARTPRGTAPPMQNTSHPNRWHRPR